MVALEEVLPDNKLMTETAKILVVDDESNILDVLELYLLREGFQVVRAADGQAALRQFNDNQPARKVEVKGKPVELTAKEFDLLWFLANNQGQVFSREQLLDRVWDYSFFGEMSTVTVHIRRLREKVEADPMRPRHIKTVWGV